MKSRVDPKVEMAALDFLKCLSNGAQPDKMPDDFIANRIEDKARQTCRRRGYVTFKNKKWSITISGEAAIARGFI